MSGKRRLSIAFVVPGHNLLASAGPTRNVLSLATALAEEADVVVAFRRFLEPFEPHPFRVVEIDPGTPVPERPADDAAVRGVGLREFLRYVQAVGRFTARTVPLVDVVLEKSWLLSGYVAARSVRLGVPGILVENIPPLLRDPGAGVAGLPRRARHRAARMWAGRYARRASRIIAETEELRRSLALGWRIPESRIEVVGLGVDRSLFRPLDQAAARRRLHIDPDARVLLYAGVLDQTHNLIPLLEALQATGVPGATLHIAGDGKLRGAYEERARVATIPVLFHGRVPHERMPELIAAADLCLAPYERAVFPEGHVAYSTLKIPEYLACGKPVASVPSGNIARLVRSGATGFLLENEAREWAKLLRSLPTRDRLREMGKAAAADVPAPDWGETAARYLSICEREVSSAERGRAGRERA